MPWTFNPFTGNFDQKGSGGGGGGSAFFAGEVATYADLPLDGTAALNSRWLVRSNSGTWPFSSYKQAGIYIRIGTVGSDRDDDYQLTDTSFHDVMSDDAFLLFADADATKNLAFQLSGISANTTRTITVPDKSGTLAMLDDVGGGGEVRSDFVSPYTYTGLADAGTSESTASWLIRRSEFDAGGSFVATLTASAVEWDDRLTASYA
jgi:hypothetical protein